AMLVARVLPAAAGLALWGVLALAAGVFTGVLDRIDASDAGPSWRDRITKSAGLVAIVYGATLLVGAAAGANDPLRPLAFLAARAGGA
ncbi:hypothetical protein L0M97_13295, partial [[Ruminococcus] torques]|uniref:hypothetical protein n=1 Tax=[Ruminococcus] torques TaxID=33039 RepID=UPI001EDCCEA5|nr:hypothetical protein [[Ruminococcus] torques]